MLVFSIVTHWLGQINYWANWTPPASASLLFLSLCLSQFSEYQFLGKIQGIFLTRIMLPPHYWNPFVSFLVMPPFSPSLRGGEGSLYWINFSIIVTWRWQCPFRIPLGLVTKLGSGMGRLYILHVHTHTHIIPITWFPIPDIITQAQEQ